MTVERCIWGRRTSAACDAPAKRLRLCDVHLGLWPTERYIHGAQAGGRRTRSDGYVELAIDGLWHLEHRLVMAKSLGRHLETREVVVHRDYNRSNNELENLWLTDKSHAMAHAKERPEQPTDRPRTFNVDVRFTIKVEAGHDLVFEVDDVVSCIVTPNELTGCHVMKEREVRN